MPLMSPARQQAMQSVDKTFSVPVDVDTAAARLKRHYKFISTQELEALRQAANDGDWKRRLKMMRIRLGRHAGQLLQNGLRLERT